MSADQRSCSTLHALAAWSWWIPAGVLLVVACADRPHYDVGTGGPASSSAMKVWSGTATMLFDGPSCTREAGAPGDRWCAFIGLSSANTRNLFVVNVSRVASGAAVRCDGAGGPDCLLLTPSLGGDSLDPTLHGTFFQGDTLVYYDAALVPHVWRPGMAAGRRLVDPTPGIDVVVCTPATHGTVVGCLALPALQPNPNLTQAELLAGSADGASDPIASSIETVITANAADAGGPSRFGFGFPVGDDESIAWSSRGDPSGPEILKLQKAGDPSTRIAIASDVHGWDVSPDGSRWFWLTGIDRAGIGLLQTASFPDGASLTDVQANVLEYGLPPASDGAVVTLDSSGALAAIPDPVGAPGTRLPLDAGVQALVALSTQGHVAYAKHFVGASLVDLFIRKPDGTSACAVDTTTSVPHASIHFTPDAGAAVWALKNGVAFDGHYTRLRDCATMLLAPNVVALEPFGDRVVYLDDFDDTTRAGSLRYRVAGADNVLTPDAPTLVATHVDSYELAGPAPGAVVYTVFGRADADGVYVLAW